MPTIPRKLRQGDMVRVIAPSSALRAIGAVARKIIDARFAAVGLTCTFGAHIDECDDFESASVQSRVDDLHAAFADDQVAGIITVIGGYNANQMLPYLDWQLIRDNPKILCGYSDITALQAAMLAQADLVTYSGPHWSGFGMRDHFEMTQQGFLDCLFGAAPFDLRVSDRWSDDEWFLDQNVREWVPNEGWWVLRQGAAAGRIVGGNLCTLNLLQGTPYLPRLADSVLVIEDDFESRPHTFDRDLASLLQQPDAGTVRGLVIGRFQKRSNMSRELLRQIVETKRELDDLPIIANVDIGHTNPLLTFPIGGSIDLVADGAGSRISITEH